MRFFQQFGDMQKRLGRDTAAVQANSSGIEFRIDERYAHAKIGGEKCGGISTGTAANDCYVEGLVI
jgi:hypothetical protein